MAVEKFSLNKFLSRRTISQKLTISYFLMGVLSMFLVSFFCYKSFKDALLDRTFAQLSSINILKKTQLEDQIALEYAKYGTMDSINFEKIQYILLERTGIGETGESYIVDEQYKMRTRSRFYPEKKPGQIEVKTEAVTKGLKEKEGFGIISDYRGEKVLSYYRKFAFPKVNWVLVTEIDYKEAIKPVNKVRDYLLGVVILFSIIIVVITLLLSKRIADPIVAIQRMLDQLSQGKIPIERLRYEDEDEIGRMVVALNQLIDGIKSTTIFAYETGLGNFKAAYAPLSKDDLLGNTLLQMRDKLVELQVNELMQARQRSAAVVEGQEKERQRLARELHDGIGQLLTGIRFKLDVLNLESAKKEELKKIVDETIEEVRRISHNAMPSTLTDFGLESALKAMCVNVSKLGSLQVEYDYNVLGDSKALSFDISTTLYRIAQEGLNNILKYANASKVLLEIYSENQTIVLELSDNGKGFTKNPSTLGNGLLNIKERAKLCGGSATITTAEGKGTKIKVVLPFNSIS